jgi:hypothetical protein
MNTVRKFRPRLQDCVLEDRLLPAIANLGVIVLTTNGYVLMTPFPGVSGDLGGVAHGASGILIPTSFFITGSGGISSIQPGNLTGLPDRAAAGTTGASGSAGLSIVAGSGVNDATALSIPQVNHNTIAFDTLKTPITIGRLSGDRSPVLPAGQIYQGGVPMIAPASAAPAPESERPSPPPGTGPVNRSPILGDGAHALVSSDALRGSLKTVADSGP